MENRQIQFAHKRAIVVSFIALLYALCLGFDSLHSNGWGDATRKAATPGCICHNFELDTTVTVWIVGSDTVTVGSTNNYTIFMKGGPAGSGGYNVACNNGQLFPGDPTSDYPTNAPLELSHSSPKSFSNDTVSWAFQYKAPLTLGTDTIYSVGNSTNDNHNPDAGDVWNLGNNFPVAIVLGVDVAPSETPLQYTLMQNYPNPFNPATTISFRLEHQSEIDLSVYNTRGQKLVTLVNGSMLPGLHSLKFEGQHFASGIYFYRLHAGDFIEIKKMLLIK